VTAPASLRVGIGDLLQRPGTRRDVERELRSEGLSVTGSRVPAGATVAVDLVVESTADPGTLTITGTVTAPWVGECRRCLAQVEGELETEVHEVFGRTPVDEEIWPLDGDEIDLGEVVREALLLALPLAPLCSADCRGPAPDEFPAVPADEAESEGEPEQPLDPRWAALDELRFDD
jgi:uncharacterized protein